MARIFSNPEIARLLREIAAAYELRGEPHYKIQAYQTAASSVEHATSMVKDMWDDGRLAQLPGVGTTIAKYLDELFRTGEVEHFEKVKRGLPKGMFVLLDVPGVGPRTAYRLATELKIQTVEELREAAQKGRVQKLKGFGPKTEGALLRGIDEFERRTTRMLLPRAVQMADDISRTLEAIRGVVRVDPLGSLRRRVATVGDIDIGVAVSSKASALKVVAAFTGHANVHEVIERGPSKASVVWQNGKQLDLRVQEIKSYGALLQHFTGSKAHNIHLRKVAQEKGLSLSEYGIRSLTSPSRIKTFAKEEDFYRALGLEWIPPELREDTGEIEAAQAHRLPVLVQTSDIRGDLHLHCDFDLEESHDPGRSSMEDYARKASSLGYQYVAIGNHNPSVYNHPRQDVINLLKRKSREIQHVQRQYPRVRLLNQVEVDILANGQLAIPDEGLKLLDVVVVSIHSGMRQPRAKLTQRVVNALAHPYTHILAHPTGRLLTQREGYELDWEAVFAAAKAHHKAIEINSFYNRLDLPDYLVREAVEEGVKLVINTDAHQVEQMDLIEYGVAVARRGWAKPEDVLNTYSWEDMLTFLRKG